MKLHRYAPKMEKGVLERSNRLLVNIIAMQFDFMLGRKRLIVVRKMQKRYEVMEEKCSIKYPKKMRYFLTNMFTVNQI